MSLYCQYFFEILVRQPCGVMFALVTLALIYGGLNILNRVGLVTCFNEFRALEIVVVESALLGAQTPLWPVSMTACWKLPF